jgi:hypothetical protein
MTTVKITNGPSGSVTSSGTPGEITLNLNTDKEGVKIVGTDDNGDAINADTLPAEHLNIVAFNAAKELEFKHDSGVHAKISALAMKTGLELQSVDNTADADKPISTLQAAAIATKIGLNDLPAHQPIAFIDGLAAALGDKLDKATYNADQALQALGIKYEWASPAAQVAQTGMVSGEQGVLVSAGGAERDVYKFNGSAWVYAYKLSASHNHDDRYYTEAEIDAKLLGKLVAGDLPTHQPASFIDGLTDALNAKAPASSVKTAVPAGAVFTDEKWAGEAAALERIGQLETKTGSGAVTHFGAHARVSTRTVVDEFLSVQFNKDVDDFRLGLRVPVADTNKYTVYVESGVVNHPGDQCFDSATFAPGSYATLEDWHGPARPIAKGFWGTWWDTDGGRTFTLNVLIYKQYPGQILPTDYDLAYRYQLDCVVVPRPQVNGHSVIVTATRTKLNMGA